MERDSPLCAPLQGTPSFPRANALMARFEEEVTALEARLHYRFRNRATLVRALTFPGAVANTALSNRKLEKIGDLLLTRAVRQYTERFTREVRCFMVGPLESYLRSNLHLSRMGVRLQINRAVRVPHTRALGDGPTHDIRTFANTMEALIGAVAEDGGEHAARGFMRDHVIRDPREHADAHVLSRLFCNSVREQERAAQEFFATPVSVVHHTSGGKKLLAIATAPLLGCEVRTVGHASIAEGFVMAVQKLGRTFPWIWWGKEKDEKPFLPCAAIGLWPASQSVARVKQEVEATPLSTTPRPKRFCEEVLWGEVELPPIMAISSGDCGPAIDRVRLHHCFAEKTCIVRERSRKGKQESDYAFFAGDEHLFTVKGVQTLRAAAYAFLRWLGE